MYGDNPVVLAIQVVLILLALLIARAVGLEISAFVWAFAWAIAKLVAVLPISLGGLGVREAILAALLTPFGAIATVVVAAGLVWQAVLISAGAFGGLLLVISGQRAFSTRAPDPKRS